MAWGGRSGREQWRHRTTCSFTSLMMTLCVFPSKLWKIVFFRGIFVKLKILHENVSSLLRPGSEAEYWDDRVCLSVTVHPSVSLRFTKFSGHVCGRGSVFLWRHGDVLFFRERSLISSIALSDVAAHSLFFKVVRRWSAPWQTQHFSSGIPPSSVSGCGFN